MSETESLELAERAERARAALCSCRLCARCCGVNRLEGECGYCGLDAGAYWFREFIHYGVEFELIPAHAIYLAGCNLRCVFCTARRWNAAPAQAARWDSTAMAALADRRRAEGAGTILFVGGEPTVSLPAVLEMLAALPGRSRVAWDSNMYMSAEAWDLLDGVVDVYLGDLKFGNDACAREIADAPDYMETVTENLRIAERTAALIVRHLLLPGHLDCCFRPVLEWMAGELDRPRLALRGEYLPPEDVRVPGALAGYVGDDELQEAMSAAKRAGVELVD